MFFNRNDNELKLGTKVYIKEKHKVSMNLQLFSEEDSETETEQKEIEIEQKETETEQKEVEIDEKETETEQKEAEIEQKETEIEQKEVEIDEKETETEQKEAEAEQKEVEIDKKETEAEQKETEAEQKETEAEQKEVEIDKKETETDKIEEEQVSSDLGSEASISYISEMSDKKKNNIPVIAAVVAIIAVIAAAVFAMSGNNNNKTIENIEGLYEVLDNTSEKYDNEIYEISKNNEVFKQFAEMGESKTAHSFSVMGAELIFVNSAEDKRFDMYISAPMYLKENIEFFLSDEDILFGAENNNFFASTSSTIKNDLMKLFAETGVSEYDIEMMTSIFDNIEFSYDGLTEVSQVNNKEDIFNKYNILARELFRRGKFSVAEEVRPYIDNGSNIERKVQIVTVSLTSGEMAEWLETDLIPTMEADEELKSFIMDSQANRTYGYGETFEYEELIESMKEVVSEIKENPDIKIDYKFVVYNGNMIGLELYIEDNTNGEESKFEVIFETKGEKNLLDDILITIKIDDEETFRLSIKGDHITTNKFNSVIEYNSSTDTANYEINWDTTAQKDNFVIKGVDTYGDDINFVATLAKVDESVVGELALSGITVYYEGKAVDEIKELPTETVPLSTVTMDKIYEFYMSIMR